MKCKNLKIKVGNIPYCKIKKIEINYMLDCVNCKHYEFDKKYVSYDTKICSSDRMFTESKKPLKTPKNTLKIKRRKVASLERGRKSILTNNLERCHICAKKKEHLHEVYFGRNRINSMKYNCVIPLCFDCHNKIHSDSNLDMYYKKKMQERFIEVYPDLNFVDIFKKNYL